MSQDKNMINDFEMEFNCRINSDGYETRYDYRPQYSIDSYKEISADYHSYRVPVYSVKINQPSLERLLAYTTERKKLDRFISSNRAASEMYDKLLMHYSLCTGNPPIRF
jgi:hypothetical protein